jgi:hypothetical protein
VDAFKSESRMEVDSRSKTIEKYAHMIHEYVVGELDHWQNVHSMYIKAS